MFEAGRVRLYHQPATVQTTNGRPARFQAGGRTYLVLEVLGPHWEHLLPWWQPEHAGKTPEELTVRCWRVRARGTRRDAVVELAEHAGTWTLIGVED